MNQWYINQYMRVTSDLAAKVFINIKLTYTPGKKYLEIPYNNRLYKLSSRYSNTGMIGPEALLDMDMPYPDDIMEYIRMVDDLVMDKLIIRRFLVKIRNESDELTRDAVLHNLAIAHKPDFPSELDFLPRENKEYLYKLIKEVPEAIETFRKISTNNLLLGE